MSVLFGFILQCLYLLDAKSLNGTWSTYSKMKVFSGIFSTLSMQKTIGTEDLQEEHKMQGRCWPTIECYLFAQIFI